MLPQSQQQNTISTWKHVKVVKKQKKHIKYKYIIKGIVHPKNKIPFIFFSPL